jgi:hypothetical protein
VPTGDPRFRRTERLRLEWPVFEAPDRHGPRLLDRKGGVLAVPLVTEATDGHDGTGWITADLPLAPFAHGDYVVELTAARGTEEQRLTSAFRVVR